MTGRLARWCSTHARRTIVFWALVALAGLATALLAMGGLTTEGRETGVPESQRGYRLIAQAFPNKDVPSDVVVVRSERYRADDARFRAFLARLRPEARRAGVLVVGHGAPPVSRDGHTMLVPVDFEKEHSSDVIAVVQRADASPDFAVTITGENTLDHDFAQLSQHDLKSGELRVGLPAALVVLLLVFGAVVAGLVPLLLALVSIAVGLGIVALLSQPFELSVFIVNMLTGMGLALGIDYSLFVISRYREERGRGRESLDAVAAAGATASRAVLFSGSAFVVAMFGMFLVKSTIMRSLALGAIVVGVVSVAAALTLLPAVLGVLGDRVNALRLPFFGRSVDRTDPEGRFWRAIVTRVLRRPVVSLALSAALLLAAASPVFGLHIGANGVASLPDRLEAKRGFLAVERYFPTMTTDPVEVVASGVRTSAARHAVATVAHSLSGDRRFGPATVRRKGDVAWISAPVRGDAMTAAAVSAVRDIRKHLVRTAFAGTGATVYVTGTSQEHSEYFDAVTKPAVYVFAFVLGLTLVLLTLAFRSLVVALTAIVLNLLSVGAAYGLLVLVFQHGVAAGLLGFQQVDIVEAWVPLFLFSVLFGLSMDYQVFLLSRVKERFDETGDTAAAIAFGVATTARIITGAALIIVAVFAGFAMGDMVMFQQMGFGVGVALLLDATVIRSVVLPSAMRLLGERNWYLPRWLDWLPRLEVEPPPPGAASPTPG